MLIATSHFSPNSISVELTPSEIYLSGQVGVRRRMNGSMMGKAANRLRDQSKDTWDADIEAACAECAAAKALDRFWSGAVNTFSAPDLIGGKIGIKYTDWATGRLALKERDPIGQIYVLVTGKCPRFVVHGYMSGAQIKTKEFWDEEKQGWWVPQDRLLNIEDLRNPAARVTRVEQIPGDEEFPEPAW
jgi:hypothetical protein